MSVFVLCIQCSWKVSDLLELEYQWSGATMWVLETEPGSLRRQEVLLTDVPFLSLQSQNSTETLNN